MHGHMNVKKTALQGRKFFSYYVVDYFTNSFMYIFFTVEWRDACD
jgi:hypothetical protein